MEIYSRKEEKKTKTKKNKGGSTSYNESVRAKWFCCEFKLGFAQLICKTSLIFKLHLVFALSIIFLKRIIQVKPWRGGV